MSNDAEQPKRKIVIKSEEERLVFGEVYVPLHVDTHGEAMTSEEIKRMAYDFLSTGKVNKVDVQHDLQVSGCKVVESFLARKNDPDGFIEGAWVLGVKVIPDEIWEQVKKGELNGYSWYGTRAQIPVKAAVLMTTKMDGETEDSMEGGLLPVHRHNLSLTFDLDGRIIPTITGVSLEHVHDVVKATATNEALGHSHRLVVMED